MIPMNSKHSKGRKKLFDGFRTAQPILQPSENQRAPKTTLLKISPAPSPRRRLYEPEAFAKRDSCLIRFAQSFDEPIDETGAMFLSTRRS